MNYSYSGQQRPQKRPVAPVNFYPYNSSKNTGSLPPSLSPERFAGAALAREGHELAVAAERSTSPHPWPVPLPSLNPLQPRSVNAEASRSFTSFGGGNGNTGQMKNELLLTSHLSYKPLAAAAANYRRLEEFSGDYVNNDGTSPNFQGMVSRRVDELAQRFDLKQDDEVSDHRRMQSPVPTTISAYSSGPVSVAGRAKTSSSYSSLSSSKSPQIASFGKQLSPSSCPSELGSSLLIDENSTSESLNLQQLIIRQSELGKSNSIGDANDGSISPSSSSLQLPAIFRKRNIVKRSQDLLEEVEEKGPSLNFKGEDHFNLKSQQPKYTQSPNSKKRKGKARTATKIKSKIIPTIKNPIDLLQQKSKELSPSGIVAEVNSNPTTLLGYTFLNTLITFIAFHLLPIFDSLPKLFQARMGQTTSSLTLFSVSVAIGYHLSLYRTLIWKVAYENENKPNSKGSNGSPIKSLTITLIFLYLSRYVLIDWTFYVLFLLVAKVPLIGSFLAASFFGFSCFIVSLLILRKCGLLSYGITDSVLQRIFLIIDDMRMKKKSQAIASFPPPSRTLPQTLHQNHLMRTPSRPSSVKSNSLDEGNDIISYTTHSLDEIVRRRMDTLKRA